MLRDPRKARPGKVVGLIFIILSIAIRIGQIVQLTYIRHASITQEASPTTTNGGALPRTTILSSDHSRGFAHSYKSPWLTNGAKPPKVHARYGE